MFLLRYEVIATTESASLHPYMLQTLSKWSNKVQSVAPSAFLPLNRGAFLKGHKHLQFAVQVINENLSDKTKLIERTRVVRVKKERIARPLQLEPESEIPDLEIFDDTDFYQKLLQSVIDLRGSGVRDEGWELLQKQKRERKKADPKASKGRKLRYVFFVFLLTGNGVISLSGLKLTKKCRISWCLSQWLVLGMRNRRMSYFPRYSERVLRVRSLMSRRGCRTDLNYRVSECLDSRRFKYYISVTCVFLPTCWCNGDYAINVVFMKTRPNRFLVFHQFGTLSNVG